MSRRASSVGSYRKTLPIMMCSREFLGVPFHHWCAAIAPATSIGHKGEVAGAKVLAGTILDLLQSPELVQRVRECFLEENKGVKYEPLLPPDTRPDVDLNKQMMDSLRPEMKKYYLNKEVKFV